MVGMALGKQLEPIKDEVDYDVISKAVKSTLKGEKLLMTEDQARETSEAFGEKMQAEGGGQGRSRRQEQPRRRQEVPRRQRARSRACRPPPRACSTRS